ncbi:MAG: branched-chain amino acid aminotransferase [Bacteroidales bacterium]|nr:branched-chain amino acid aminotransferase [Bacteroidales bacterium]
MLNLDWGNLPFGYVKTNCNIRAYYREGKWSDIEVFTDDKIDMHIAATCLHYGQECFEGMKAYRGKDGKIRLFRWEENAKRLNVSADRILVPQLPLELFKKALFTVIEKNHEFVPPFGTGASMYIRPLLIGTGAQVGINPASEYTLIFFVTPVGPYFKCGFAPVDVLIERNTDRAAPQGTGNVKVGGNYAASVKASIEARKENFSSLMYLDAKEKKYIDECGPANFFAIKDKTYITPASPSILPSITNNSLIELAKDLGLKVERRKIEVSELDNFEEVGQCGTAAVISPIKRIVDKEKNKEYTFCKDGNVGVYSTKLYNLLTGIQFGEVVDTHNWITILEV